MMGIFAVYEAVLVLDPIKSVMEIGIVIMEKMNKIAVCIKYVNLIRVCIYSFGLFYHLHIASFYYVARVQVYKCTILLKYLQCMY